MLLNALAGGRQQMAMPVAPPPVAPSVPGLPANKPADAKGGMDNSLFHQQRQDWMGLRPDYAPGVDPSVWRQQMSDWRGLRPDHNGAMQALGAQPVPSNTGIVPPGMLPPIQQQPIAQPPTQPAGPYGTQLGVIGAQAATSPFGLPSY